MSNPTEGMTEEAQHLISDQISGGDGASSATSDIVKTLARGAADVALDFVPGGAAIKDVIKVVDKVAAEHGADADETLSNVLDVYNLPKILDTGELPLPPFDEYIEFSPPPEPLETGPLPLLPHQEAEMMAKRLPDVPTSFHQATMFAPEFVAPPTKVPVARAAPYHACDDPTGLSCAPKPVQAPRAPPTAAAPDAQAIAKAILVEQKRKPVVTKVVDVPSDSQVVKDSPELRLMVNKLSSDKKVTPPGKRRVKRKKKPSKCDAVCTSQARKCHAKCKA